jgi:hypothetical protein
MAQTNDTYYMIDSPVSGGSHPDKIQDWINYLYTMPQNPEVVFEVKLAEEQLRESQRQRGMAKKKTLLRKR